MRSLKASHYLLGDTTGTEDYEERTVSERTDDWNIRYVDKERIK